MQPDHIVAEWLSHLSELHPLPTVQILRLKIEGAVRNWFVVGARESIETNLHAGLDDAGGEAASVARDVVNMCRLGGLARHVDRSRVIEARVGAEESGARSYRQSSRRSCTPPADANR